MTSDLQSDIDAIGRIDAVPTILDVVCRTTGMGFAAVARVTEDRWVACQVLDHIAFGLKPGGALKVETTLCHEIRQHRQPVVIDNVAESPAYRSHHTPEIYGLQSYISMPIVLPDGRFSARSAPSTRARRGSRRPRSSACSASLPSSSPFISMPRRGSPRAKPGS